jgi:hypothetical protein
MDCSAVAGPLIAPQAASETSGQRFRRGRETLAEQKNRASPRLLLHFPSTENPSSTLPGMPPQSA